MKSLTKKSQINRKETKIDLQEINKVGNKNIKNSFCI